MLNFQLKKIRINTRAQDPILIDLIKLKTVNHQSHLLMVHLPFVEAGSA